MRYRFEELFHSLIEELDKLSNHIERNNRFLPEDKLHIADFVIGIQSHLIAMQGNIDHLLWLEKKLKS